MRFIPIGPDEFERMAQEQDRKVLISILIGIGVDDSAVDDLAVVFSELTSNAVDASPDHNAAVRVHAYQEHGHVVLEVNRNARSFEIRPGMRYAAALSLNRDVRAAVVLRLELDAAHVPDDARRALESVREPQEVTHALRRLFHGHARVVPHVHPRPRTSSTRLQPAIKRGLRLLQQTNVLRKPRQASRFARRVLKRFLPGRFEQAKRAQDVLLVARQR